MLHALFYAPFAYAGGATNTEPGLVLGLVIIGLGAFAVVAAFVRMSGGPGPGN